MDPYLTLSTKINLKWVIDLNIRIKTMKLSEENIEINLCNLVLGNGFLDVTAKHKWIDKLDFKIKNLWLQRTSTNKGKTTHRMGENICKAYI